MCLNPCQGVLHLLLVKSESFEPAEKPSITGGAMCAVSLEAPLPCCNLCISVTAEASDRTDASNGHR